MTNSHIIYRVEEGAQVIVIDKDFAMHQHRMKGFRDFRADNRLRESYGEPLAFSGVKSTQQWSITELGDLEMWVFATGHSKWPYIIVKKDQLQGQFLETPQPSP